MDLVDNSDDRRDNRQAWQANGRDQHQGILGMGKGSSISMKLMNSVW